MYSLWFSLTYFVVESAACDDVSGRPVCAGHHPRRRHRHRVLLVRRERVPHDQLAILPIQSRIGRAERDLTDGLTNLRRGDQMSLVRAPVEAEDLRVVALQTPSHLPKDDNQNRMRKSSQVLIQ